MKREIQSFKNSGTHHEQFYNSEFVTNIFEAADRQHNDPGLWYGIWKSHHRLQRIVVTNSWTAGTKIIFSRQMLIFSFFLMGICLYSIQFQRLEQLYWNGQIEWDTNSFMSSIHTISEKTLCRRHLSPPFCLQRRQSALLLFTKPSQGLFRRVEQSSRVEHCGLMRFRGCCKYHIT